jgi:MFS family permease
VSTPRSTPTPVKRPKPTVGRPEDPTAASRPPATAARAGTRPGAAGLVLAVAAATIFFDAFDLSITQIALPSIQASLHISTGALSWVAAAYVVTYGGFLLLGGRAGDLFGSRPVLLTGLGVFGTASLACGVAGNSGVLVAARAVQGVGAALTVPAAVAVLAATFTAERARARAFGIFSAAAASGFSVGLVLGGLITSGLSWRWIFLAKVPAVAATLLVALRAIPAVPWAAARRPRRGEVDLPGGLTVTCGVVLLTYGITQAGRPHAAIAGYAVPLALAAVLLLGFAVIESRAPAPLLPGRLLRDRVRGAADAAALTVLAAPFGVSFVVALYLQDVQGRSPLSTAMTLLPGSATCVAVARYLAPVVLGRFGLRPVYAGGLLVVAAGDALLAVVGPARPWTVVVATLVSFGMGMGLAYPAATVGGVHATGPAEQAMAAGLNNTALQIGGAVGLSLVAAAVTVGLHGGTAAAASAGTALRAARYGAAVAAVLPLLGALTVLVGMPRTLRRRNSSTDGAVPHRRDEP